MVIEQMMEPKDNLMIETTPTKDEKSLYEHLYKSDIQPTKTNDYLDISNTYMRKSFHESNLAAVDARKRLSIRTGSHGVVAKNDGSSNSHRPRGVTDFRQLYLSTEVSTPNHEKMAKHLNSSGKKRLNVTHNGPERVLGLEENGQRKTSRLQNPNNSGKKMSMVKSGTQILEIKETKTDWFVNIINSLDKKLKEIKVSIRKK
jgi:hypothetical protein